MPHAGQEFVAGVSAQDRAGTPLPLVAPLIADHVADALETLELAAVVELVAGRAAGPLGAARVRARRPTDDLAWIREELAAVGEVAALFRRGDALLAEAVPDVAQVLGRLRIAGSMLDGPHLAAVHRLIVAARRVQADLRRVADTAPRAAALARELPDKAIDRRLEQSVGSDGELLDSASPRLAAARREVHAARQRLIRRLEGVIRSLDASAVPVDATVTVRGGRYVIPVRRDSRHRPGGIVHDESGSAGTLFVEPAEAIELGNAFREAEVAEERETLRVLRELTDLLRPELPALRGAVEMCTAVDDLVARARYAVDCEGEVPAVAPAPAPLHIVYGRHPLLLGGTEPVVPFDLELSPAERTLLISGPNTGGKTVLLKAVGLAAALAQSGIVPPVGPGSALPVFRRYYADIGDRQSIAASLSTFSAHVRTLRRVLEESDDATLVLLDEIGSGTDPAEGAALAAATLVSLTERGTLTLATTHLGSLKDLASRTPGVVNASLHFDAATLTPTYRFHKGVPGRSYGLAIARRLGIAPDILADAEARVPAEERSLDALLAAAEARDRELHAAQHALEERTIEVDALGAKLDRQRALQVEREAELVRRERDAERQGRRQVRDLLLEARQQVEEALAAARTATDEAAARDARRRLEDRIRVEGERLAAAEENPAEVDAASGAVDGAVAPGGRVRIASGQTGDVLEIRPDGKLVVAVGAMRMVVERAGVVPLSGAERRKERAASAAVGGAAAPARREAVLEIDLRGMTGEEAEQATVAAVDAAVLAEQPYLRIIHGKGTGVVRERVRQVVAKDRRIARFGLAPQNQGGAGVTIVEFSGVSMIPDDVIEQVRDSADIVALVGEAVELKRTGSDYRGPCPFHGGTHRNFAVIPKKGRYYCFVCHESGDVFSWLMKRFGMDYPTAVREIARRTGIVIPERPGRAGPDPREPLFGAVAAAQDWFARQLQEAPVAQGAREYLVGRDVPLETAAVLGLGYAPGGKEFLDAMATLGVAPGVLVQAGLAIQREDGSVVSRFRNRLLFPIHDLRARVAGFGGRLLGPGEPKYLNSPESDVFQKGKLLYNLHQAKGAIRKAEEVVLVEGYFDVLRLSLAGLEQVVAPLGTGLTSDQGALLRRFAPAAILLYDSDQAGLRATFRTADELLRHGVRVRVATLPPGEDPDTMVRAGGLAALEPVLRDALDVMERKIQLLDRRGWFTGVEHRREALDRLLPTIRAASDSITRELYLSLVAERTGVSKDVLERELHQSRRPEREAAPPQPAARIAPGESRPRPRDRARSSPETQLLQVMIMVPEWVERARAEVAPPLFESARLREIFEALLQAGGAGDQMPPGLSDDAQVVWSRLKETAQDLAQLDVARMYDRAVQIICARPEYRRMAVEPDPGEKRRRRAELQARYPEADRWYTWRRKGV